MADALIAKLSNFDQIKVRPTSSIIKYAGHEFDSLSAGKELGVDTVLDGTIQHLGERVRVTVMLWSIRDGKALWSGKFDERSTDIFALQDSIAEKLASVLQLQLATGKQNKHITENAEAYRDYAMGLYFWNKRSREGLTKAIEYFQKATEADHNFALAYAMLADAYCLTIFYDYNILPSSEILLRAEEAVVRACQLDDKLAEAYAAMGLLKTYKNDPAGAEQAYKRAIELNPNSAMSRYRHAFSLLSRLQIEGAIREMRRAQELDPISLPINTTLASCYLYAGQYDEAIKYSKLALEVDPQFGLARFNLGKAYEWKGLHDEATAEYMKLSEQRSFRLYGKLGLAFVYARSGRQHEARRLIGEVKSQFTSDETFFDLPLQIAATYAVLGDKDEAFAWMERAVERVRFRRYDLRYSRPLNTLKDDPRYEQILRRHEFTRSFVSELSKQN
jgi:tetratricopeptide (TPR) repeat protein